MENTGPRNRLQNSVENLNHRLCTEALKNKTKWNLKDFEVGAPLGRGKFGRVFVAREKTTNFKVAIKVLSKSKVQKGRVEHQVVREIEIQSKLRHPNILSILTYFHDRHKIYLILEYAALGELFMHLRRAKCFTEPTSAKFTYQVADALHYCHLNSVIHRDLKPENILVTVKGNIKLADFGWSVHAPSNSRKTMCGTIDYLPPEMVKKEAHNNCVDCWCLGVLCYEFLVGSPPFEGEDTCETFKKIRSVTYTLPPSLPIGAADVIRKLLKSKPNDRITLPEVMKHPWVNYFKNASVIPDKNGYVK